MLDPKSLASNLRHPDGELGIRVGQMMHKGNANFYLHLPDLLNLQGDEAVLEIGMGAGIHLADYSKYLPKGELFGLDYSQTMVDQAERNCKDLSQVKIIQGDALNLPFGEHFFDVLYTINTVYFYDLKRAFDQYYRVLRPGGKLVIGKRTKEDLLQLGEVTQHGFNLISATEVNEVAKHCGFEFKTEITYDDSPVQINDRLLQLHSQFLSFQKPLS